MKFSLRLLIGLVALTLMGALLGASPASATRVKIPDRAHVTLTRTVDGLQAKATINDGYVTRLAIQKKTTKGWVMVARKDYKPKRKVKTYRVSMKLHTCGTYRAVVTQGQTWKVPGVGTQVWDVMRWSKRVASKRLVVTPYIR